VSGVKKKENGERKVNITLISSKRYGKQIKRKEVRKKRKY
jgi:hypothetical protein